MRLSEIDRQASFALLGPGFTGGGYLLLARLREAEGDPAIVFLPYEGAAREARRFTGDPVAITALEWDVPACSLQPRLDTTGFEDAVQAIRAAIAAGDVYQVNHTLRAAIAPVSGAALLHAFSRREVPRFCAWVRVPGGAEFVSASPELFFELDGRRIRTEPMKGTAPLHEEAALVASEKDRAELAMITDLLRNDLAQVCEPRSVRVVSARRLLRLAYAVQAVSDVEGMLAPGTTVSKVLEALVPGGSITGAPKRAACELISRLEPAPRGAYCGTLGLLRGSRAVFSLLIRTAERTPHGWTYGVGSGITWGSDPAAELAEVRLKLGAIG